MAGSSRAQVFFVSVGYKASTLGMLTHGINQFPRARLAFVVVDVAVSAGGGMGGEGQHAGADPGAHREQEKGTCTLLGAMQR